MFVDNLDNKRKSAVFASFFAETAAALNVVFAKSEGEASNLVRALEARFAGAPGRERDFLLHNDPVALASELAEVPWANVDMERLEAFNRLRRQRFLAKV